MMQALLLAWALVQDDGLTLEGHTRRNGTEYELMVSGEGRGLSAAGEVTLRLHRLQRRYDWEQKRFGLAADEEAPARVTTAVDDRFEHVERFKAPTLVEARVGVAGEPGRVHRRVWRVGSAADAAAAGRLGARRMETALRLLRSAFEDADVLGGPVELSARRARELKKRLEWRFSALRGELEGTPLSATAGAILGLMSDLEAALELLGAGNSIEGLISNLGSVPFTWAGAREAARRIEGLAIRERGLLALELGEALRLTVEERVRAGDKAGWTRFERGSDRILEDISILVRGGSSASEQETLQVIVAAPVEDMLAHLGDLIRQAAGRIAAEGMSGMSQDDFETLSESLRVQVEQAQTQLQVSNP